MLKIIITAAMTLVALVSQAQVSESRKITDFSKIEVESGIELTYMESDENSIKVETDSKDNLANIITETNGKTLRVYYAQKKPNQYRGDFESFYCREKCKFIQSLVKIKNHF